MAAYTENMLFPFKPCSSIIVTGSSGAGKTEWVKKFLTNIDDMFGENNAPLKVLFCYSVYQPLYDIIKQECSKPIHFLQGLPTHENIFDFSEDLNHSLIVMDDLMHKAVNNEEIELLFTQYCHHRHISCIYIQQNLFFKGKHSKTISNNAFYTILFENVRDKNQIMCLGRQMYPGQVANFMKTYSDAVKKKWGYLVLDTSPSVLKKIRLRTNIFPGEEPEIFSF